MYANKENKIFVIAEEKQKPNVKIETLSDEELFDASDKLIEKNLEAYKELAK